MVKPWWMRWTGVLAASLGMTLTASCDGKRSETQPVSFRSGEARQWSAAGLTLNDAELGCLEAAASDAFDLDPPFSHMEFEVAFREFLLSGGQPEEYAAAQRDCFDHEHLLQIVLKNDPAWTELAAADLACLVDALKGVETAADPQVWSVVILGECGLTASG